MFIYEQRRLIQKEKEQFVKYTVQEYDTDFN